MTASTLDAERRQVFVVVTTIEGQGTTIPIRRTCATTYDVTEPGGIQWQANQCASLIVALLRSIINKFRITCKCVSELGEAGDGTESEGSLAGIGRDAIVVSPPPPS